MQALLDGFAATLPQDVYVALLIDGAGWHTADAITVSANVSLILLPPYAPLLNPVGRIWLYVRERFLSHRLWPSYDDILDACCSAWNALLDEAGRIRSLCSLNWAEPVSS